MALVVENRGVAAAETVTAAMAAAFVLLWSSGFIGAKLGLPYAGALTFLALRFLLAGALLLPFVLISRAPWPRSWGDAGHIAFSGVLLNCGCLGSCFYAMSLGLPAGIVSWPASGPASRETVFAVPERTLAGERKQLDPAARARFGSRPPAWLLDQLPERYREVLTLRFLKGYSIKETAHEMGITENHAKVLQFRAVQKAATLGHEHVERRD